MPAAGGWPEFGRGGQRWSLADVRRHLRDGQRRPDAGLSGTGTLPGMFTGIVAAVGRIHRVQPREQGLRLVIDAGPLDMSDVAIGDSIAVNGCCLTVVERAGARFEVDVSRETIDWTVGLAAPGDVNL